MSVEEYEQSKLDDLLIKISVAQVYLGETVNVWIGDEEAPELADEIAEGGDVDAILTRIKNKFPNQIMFWFRMEDEYGSAYYLIPRLVGHCGNKQYILHECPECNMWLGEAAICNSATPWDCAHGEYVYCCGCGSQSGLIGAIHGTHGAELNEEEVGLLLKFFEEDDE